MRRFLIRGVSAFVLCISLLITGWPAFSDVVSVQAASSSAKIHFLTLPSNTEAILLECNGQFGMVDSGEDNDYPTGSDSRYPSRPGIVQGQGYEDQVISYMRSVGVTQDNFEFYIGTHPHSDHIGSADEIIRAFHPKRVYIQEYKDSYITNPLALWDNLYVYDNMIAAAKEVGATLIQNFDPSAPLYPETVSVSGTITWDDGENQDGIRPDTVVVTLTNPVSNETHQMDVSPDASGTWRYEFSDVQKYDDNKEEIAYTVSLATPEGYTVSNASDFDFVCTHTPVSENQDVTITWDDASAPEGSRPDSLQMTLQRKTAPDSVQESTDDASSETDSPAQQPETSEPIPEDADNAPESINNSEAANPETPAADTSEDTEASSPQKTGLPEEGPDTDTSESSSGSNGSPKPGENTGSEITSPVMQEETSAQQLSFKNTFQQTVVHTTAVINSGSNAETVPAAKTQETVWEDVDSFVIIPDASGSWIYSLENLPQTDESGNPIEYRLQVENPPANYEISAPADPFTLQAVYTDPSASGETGSGIRDSQPEDPSNVSSSDGMTTDSIAASDRVDPTNPDDPTNIVSHQAPSARTGQFENLGATQNTTSTPTFTLGGSMQIEIMHYGGDYKTNPKPDANYFCLGVKVTANGKTAFLAGDINNYEGAETALASSLGHVDIVTLGHHGYYGSNTYGYLSKLSPDVMIMAGDYTAVSNNPSTDGSYGTLDTLLAMGEKGSLLYPTAWYSDMVPALVFQFNSSLSNNVPSGKSFVASAEYVDPTEKIYYKDGLPTAYTGWLESEGTYYYFNGSAKAAKNQWIQSGGKYYYLTADGSMLTEGWVLSDGIWYYVNSEGWMITSSWVKSNGSWYYVTANGSMATGRQTIDGSTYYFDSNGRMFTSVWVGNEYFGADGKLIPGYRNENWRRDATGWWYQRPDGSYPRSQWELIDGNWYYFNASGYMLTGWQQIGGSWYYLDGEGRMLTGWQKIGGSWYYMDGSGVMLTGWQLIGGSWYYMNGSGVMLTGWQYLSGQWYYMDGSGRMLTGWQLIVGSWYYMNGSGHMLTGWQFINGQWYYMNGSGAMLTGWQYINGTWYYMNNSGAMRTGWQFIGGSWYYMDASGAMLTGWQLISGTWYYMNGSGAMLTGWQFISGQWYYMDPSGHMITGWRRIDGIWYYMNGSGHMLTGWQLINGAWYYMDRSGHMLTGWQLIGGTWYYMNSSGAMLTGWQYINGQWYYMNGSGAMLTRWQYINGQWYYMNGSGHMLTGTHTIGNTTYRFADNGAWIG